MARAQATDFLQNFRFHVETVDQAGTGWNPINYTRTGESNTGVDSKAGFQSCSVPDVSMDAVEYREGTYKYTKKFAGVPTVSDVSLMRGVVVKDTAFYDWIIRAISGAEYRADIRIEQYTRNNMVLPEGAADPQYSVGENAKIPTRCARTYICHECLPTRGKPGADLDATSSEVAMAECDFALEWFEVKETEAGA
jgi:phage tail-like protein